MFDGHKSRSLCSVALTAAMRNISMKFKKLLHIGKRFRILAILIDIFTEYRRKILSLDIYEPPFV